MVKRLIEIGIIDNKTFDSFISISTEEINMNRKILGIVVPVKENHISFDTLVERSVELYNHKLISFEKLECLLKFSELKPNDIGIATPTRKPPINDDILDALEESDGI
jgi:hypothetical protein